MGIMKSVLRNRLSEAEYSFLLACVYDEYNDFSNSVFLTLIECDEIPIDYFDEYTGILYNYSEYIKNNDKRDFALVILDKLNSLRDDYYNHLSFQGVYEDEEATKILPAVKQAREEHVDCGVTLYYDDGSSYTREFRFTSNGIVFNLHRNHISFDDPQHDSCTVFNVFNFPSAEKIDTIDVSFLPCDDELSF